jgi:uncharacterized protein (TIGR02271 family)
MTTQAEQLIGAQVTGRDGQVVGTVQQIFKDDKDGTPVWARIRAGTRELFVPLGGSRATKDGLSVPFDTKQIMSSPDVNVERHMSAGQTDQLNRHFGLAIPAQAGPPDAGAERGRVQQDAAQRAQGQGGQAPRDEAERVQAERGQAERRQAQTGRGPLGEAGPSGTMRGETQRDETQRDAAQRGQDWLILAEERVDVGTEMLESGRARLHKYVDTEPVEQTVHVYHEEYEIERMPISAEEQVRGEIAEQELEITLHEERPVLHKEAVAVERVRLNVKRVDEDRTLRDEVRRERLKVEDCRERSPQPAGSAQPNQSRS